MVFGLVHDFDTEGNIGAGHDATIVSLSKVITHGGVLRAIQHVTYTRSIMNVSRTRFTHSRQNSTLAESRSEEGSLTGSSAQPDTWRIPHSSPPFQPGTHTDRAITARGEGPRPAACQCRVGMGGGGGRPLEGFVSN